VGGRPAAATTTTRRREARKVLQSYLPVLVFCGLGVVIGATLVSLNAILGPKRARKTKAKGEPYECGLPSEVAENFRFGVSFYMTAMLFIIFDVEVIFVYPVATILNATDSVFILVHTLTFIVLLAAGFVYAWGKGVLDWR